MNKELVTIEFRYNDKPLTVDHSESRTKTITVGVYDTFDDAIEAGNKAMEVFEEHFKLNPHWMKRERFSKRGGVFGSSHRLISNMAYLQTPFTFYAKIETLKYEDVQLSILEVLASTKRYQTYKKEQDED